MWEELQPVPYLGRGGEIDVGTTVRYSAWRAQHMPGRITTVHPIVGAQGYGLEDEVRLAGRRRVRRRGGRQRRGRDREAEVEEEIGDRWVRGQGEAMEEDAPEVHPLAIVLYVPPPPEDPTVLLTGALARLRIAEHKLQESEADRDRLQAEVDKLQREGERDYMALADDARQRLLEALVERDRLQAEVTRLQAKGQRDYGELADQVSRQVHDAEREREDLMRQLVEMQRERIELRRERDELRDKAECAKLRTREAGSILERAKAAMAHMQTVQDERNATEAHAHALQDERDVTAEQMSQMQTQIDQLRMAQDAWDQERRHLTGLRNMYRVERDMTRIQATERDEYMREANYYMGVYFREVPDPACRVPPYIRAVPQMPTLSRSLGTHTRGYNNYRETPPCRGLVPDSLQRSDAGSSG